MRKTKITYEIKKRVIDQKKSNPYLGVRALSKGLKQEYNLDLSKSSIYKILRDNKKQVTKKGRKPSLLLYKGRNNIDSAEFLLLRALDSDIGLFDALVDELKFYFSKIGPSLLKKLIMLAAFSAYSPGNLADNAEKKDLLKVVGLYKFPRTKWDHFIQGLKRVEPMLSFSQLEKDIRIVTAVKFNFCNGYSGYCDGFFSTFWDEPVSIPDFCPSFRHTKRILNHFVEKNTIMVHYTKSFDYFSPLVVNFVKGMQRGLVSIEILGSKGRVLDKIAFQSKFKPHFCIGYSPKGMKPNAVFLMGKTKKHKISLNQNEFSARLSLAEFSQAFDRQRVVTSNVLLSPFGGTEAFWGGITNKKKALSFYLKDYFLLWPHPEKGFLNDISLIKQSFLSPQQSLRNLDEFFPEKFILRKDDDFKKLSEILVSIFKHRVENISFRKDLRGSFVKGKSYFKVIIPKLPLKSKRKFNRCCFHFVEYKRVFLM